MKSEEGVKITMRRLNRRGQSVAEYAILFAVVIAAFAAMQTYAARGLKARVRSGTDALTGISATITSANAGTGGDLLSATFASRSQYEPYYLETFGKTYQENVEQEHMGSGKIVKEKVSDVTARAAGAFQRQRGATNRSTADDLWSETSTTTPPPTDH